ncbi:MAG: hypothetical protein Tsb0014_12500 [Pleurocapsa sp.]
MTNLSTQALHKNRDREKLKEKKASNGFWQIARNNVRLRHQSLPIPRAEERTVFPLSFNQERLWWSKQAYPNSSIQNLQHQITFTGILDLDALIRSLQEIVKRHEILRIAVRDEEGEPVQVISPEIEVELPIVDLQTLDGIEKSAEVQKLALAQAQQPFDLAQAPLWRFQLIRLAENEHILLYTVSHIVFDAWSHGVLMRELGTLYEAFAKGQPSPLMELPIQYTDFAQAQHQWLEDHKLSSQLDYWKQHLRENIPALELPTDRLRPGTPTYQPDCQFLTLPKTLTKALKTLSSEQGVSLYVMLLAAFKILLYRYTGQKELLVNSPIAGRHRSQTRGLIGCTIDTLPLRTILEPDSTFKDFLQQVSQVTENAIAHQDVPFRKLTESMNFSDASITGALFILQNVPYPVLELPNLTVSSTYLHRVNGQREFGNYFDLTLSIQENAGVLTASLAYNAVLFDKERIERVLRHYQTLLEGIVANPDCTIASLPMLTEAERHQLLTEWNSIQKNYPQDTYIHQLIATNAIALSCGNIRVYVLDKSLQPVPVGVGGDLYIDAAGIVPETLVSEENFITHPFNPDPDALLYKTGDLARYSPDGTLEFLGTTDRQVKIRGFRVNLRDIETALNQNPDLERSIVVLRADNSGNQHPVAYIVAKNEELPKNSELRHFLESMLPNYMIPSAFVPLESIPLGADGKIDYSSLPAPTQMTSELADSFVAPRIELERQLAKIWSEVLGVPSIGIRDNFFEIGGNSLLAVQVVDRIEKTCGYKMPVIDFFLAQTIEGLAKLLLSPLLQQEVWSLPWNPLEPIASEKPTPKIAKAPLFILNGGFNQFLSGAIWIAQRLRQEQPCYSLHLRGIDGREEPQDRLEEMAADAIKGIQTIQPEGPYYLAGLCFGGMVAYEMAQQLSRQGQKVALLLIVESMAPIPKDRKNIRILHKVPTPDMFDKRTRNNPVLLRVYSGVYKAIVAYRAKPYSGKLIVCQASEGTKKEQRDREIYFATWKHLAKNAELHILPGDHLSLYQEENIGTLVDKLKACLKEAQSET